MRDVFGSWLVVAVGLAAAGVGCGSEPASPSPPLEPLAPPGASLLEHSALLAEALGQQPSEQEGCGWRGWPAVAVALNASLHEARSGLLTAPTEAEAGAELGALADQLPDLAPRDQIPASGPFEIADRTTRAAWPADDPTGCQTVWDALALSTMPNPGASAIVTTQGRRTPFPRKEPGVLLETMSAGRFVLWVQRPRGVAKGTVIVRMGHSDSFEEHDARIGTALYEAGWAQVFVQARLYQGGGEDEVTRKWLRRGSSLLAVRLRESIAAGAWVRTQGWAEGRPIGLLGHSGGGVAACLVPRVFDGFDFVVSDFCSDLALPDSTSTIGDGFHPDLLPYRVLLGEVEALATPVLVVPYNFTGAQQSVVDWLAGVSTRE